MQDAVEAADKDRPASARSPRLHPAAMRVMHWLNALAMLIMIPSGWGIYDDDPILGWLYFPAWAALGHEAQDRLLWHFAGMWLLGINGLAYLIYGVVTGRFRRRLFPIRVGEVVETIRETLRFHLSHDDITRYNAVQKVLYLVVIVVGVLQVLTGLAIWKPVQLAWLTYLFGGFQSARILHFARHGRHRRLHPGACRLGRAGPPDPVGHSDGRPQGARSPGRRVMRSPHRPANPPDPAILDNHRALVRDAERRMMLRGGLSLGLLTLLTGCSPESNKEIAAALRAISSFNDKVQQRLFSPTRLAPTYAPSQVLKPPRFNAHFNIDKLKPVDGSSWKLELAGLIGDKRPWTHQQIAALPQRETIIRHVCVEGWDYIGQWSGAPLGDFLRRIGADLDAKYVAFHTADLDGKLYGSIDMATAMHPQTLLAIDYAGQTLADPFGFPLRLRMSTKLGFKNPKWITAMSVTNTYPGGYWEDQGFNWFSGI